MIFQNLFKPKIDNTFCLKDNFCLEKSFIEIWYYSDKIRKLQNNINILSFFSSRIKLLFSLKYKNYFIKSNKQIKVKYHLINTKTTIKQELSWYSIAINSYPSLNLGRYLHHVHQEGHLLFLHLKGLNNLEELILEGKDY